MNTELIKALRCESVINDEHPRCESCKYGVVVCHGSREDVYGCDSRRIENRAADALEAAEAEKVRLNTKCADLQSQINSMENEIEELLPKEGEWEERYIEDANPMFRRRFYCSRCGEWTTHGKTRYCPNCGARMMKGEQE